MSAVWAWMVAAASAGIAALAWRELRRGRELVARACHELRGPLAAAHLALHATATGVGPDGAGGPGVAPAARLAAIELELRRAGRALDDLAAARSGGRAPDREEIVDVPELLARQASTWEAVAPVFGCRLSLAAADGAALVRGDRVRLSQAVGNLLANALEHGAGTVEVRSRAVGDRVRIEVSDEGAGLPAPVAELAARPRAGRGRRGRGLAIASEIVGRHGGRLLAAPSPRGARAAIELPAWSSEVVPVGRRGGGAR
jgi:signal transduction histidine kinase